MSKLPLKQVGQSGASDGQVPVWSSTNNAWEPGSPTSTVVRTYTPGVVVRDVVYQKSDGTIDKADASAISTAPAIGFVEQIDFPAAGQAVVKFSGDLSGFAGLTVGGVYLLSKTAGLIVREDDTINPGYPDLAGEVRQVVGIGGPSGTTLHIGLSRNLLVLS